MQNFNEGFDPLLIAGLAGLPTANKLYVILCDQQESDTDPTMVFSSLTQTAGTATFSVTGLTCLSRVIDLGAFTWTETTPTTSRSALVINNAVASSPKNIAIQNLTDGSAWDTTSKGGVIVPGLQIVFAYLGEAA